ncbi:TetR/AcrR family transcriptional regulator [Amycolatopsis rhabdoformis]|uniref:TetR/AcrR family transcriptional regulator n=1 Tax=Amycolatopsis rhabdoformis TaxID=1448059 RepID=A0ABZ1I0K1_9PSEU|nr:TetR/AcrR family transcriptional regulator [Amycolatopsis rhabdoformis]WSE27899.1 TetR/AcrR family transcriptional regulator [Amycolatopsis rhabdoformis]
MTATKTARERARAELTREIKDEARRQLAEVGAHGLSLRAVARELGMVSSALYRYFPSRDRLLTDLIIDAYDAVGEAAEKADPGDGDPRTRWHAVWQATRAWAKAHPHEYALIYGSPIPGYEAPRDTVVPAARVAQALAKVLIEADPHEPAVTAPMSAVLRAQAEGLAKELGTQAPAEVVTRLIGAWTQLFGAISFELFGQYVGSVDPSDAYFEHLTGQMADFVGL